MDEFLHQVLSGIASGGIYASVAPALVMIFQATHRVNFAQGEMAMFSTLVALALIEAGVPYWGRSPSPSSFRWFWAPPFKECC